jgi:hypothetical protein
MFVGIVAPDQYSDTALMIIFLSIAAVLVLRGIVSYKVRQQHEQEILAMRYTYPVDVQWDFKTVRAFDVREREGMGIDIEEARGKELMKRRRKSAVGREDDPYMLHMSERAFFGTGDKKGMTQESFRAPHGGLNERSFMMKMSKSYYLSSSAMNDMIQQEKENARLKELSMSRRVLAAGRRPDDDCSSDEGIMMLGGKFVPLRESSEEEEEDEDEKNMALSAAAHSDGVVNTDQSERRVHKDQYDKGQDDEDIGVVDAVDKEDETEGRHCAEFTSLQAAHLANEEEDS